jgi:CBS domain-containing protein
MKATDFSALKLGRCQNEITLLTQKGRGQIMSIVSTDEAVTPDAVPLRDSAQGIAENASLLGMPLQALVQRNPITLPLNASVLEVARTLRCIGMLTASDLMRQQSTSPVDLARNIHRQTTLEGLVGIGQQVKALQNHLSAANTSAYQTGHIITAITDALTCRLIALAEADLGPPPVPCVWVAAGSQGRCEQTAKSDQDNCMVLSDTYIPALHGDYFKTLAHRVCDGLAACGYVHCPGEMMAMTDTWRQPLNIWSRYFQRWTENPEPKALMLITVFFDLRAVHGEFQLLEALRRDVLAQTPQKSLFLAHVVNNAQRQRPPLNLFGQIASKHSGAHAGTVDLKNHAITPIVDLARICALEAGLLEVNTVDRIDKASKLGELSEPSARDLRDAFEFVSRLRITHQSLCMQRDLEPDNHLNLQELSNFERDHLRDAFSVIQSLQDAWAQRYPLGLL